MSDRERAAVLLEMVPDYKIQIVLAYLQGICDGVTDVPNAETVASFKEIEDGGGISFSGSTEDLFAELLGEG